MRVPNFVLNFVKKKLMPLTAKLPDEIIGPGYRWRKNSGEPPGKLHKPFLKRWFVLPKNTWCNVYLHKFMRDDEDRAKHDHPWPNASLLLVGRYIEVTGDDDRRTMYSAGELKFRRASYAHRIELVRTRKTGHKRTKAKRERGQPSWSLFITGPVIRGWGFHCPAGWRSNAEFHERQGCD
jgi:hypothetical protein